MHPWGHAGSVLSVICCLIPLLTVPCQSLTNMKSATQHHVHWPQNKRPLGNPSAPSSGVRRLVSSLVFSAPDRNPRIRTQRSPFHGKYFPIGKGLTGLVLVRSNVPGSVQAEIAMHEALPSLGSASWKDPAHFIVLRSHFDSGESGLGFCP